jgi:signal transduction protein with GAF and PtsI domain
MKAQEKAYFDSFREVVKAVNSTLNLREVLTMLTSNVAQVMDLKACAIRLLHRKKGILELVASHGLSDNYINKGPVEADKSIADAMEGKTVSIFDAVQDPRAQYPKEAAEAGIASIVSVPLRTEDRVIGVLRLYTSKPREFSEDQIHFAEALAEMGTVAIENAKMHDRITRDYQMVRSFRDAVKAVNSSLHLNRVLDQLVRDMARILDLKACAIRLLDRKKKTLESVASHGLSEKYINKGPVNADQIIADAMDGATVSIYNAVEDPRAQYPNEAAAEGIASIVSVPLRIRGQVIGVLRLYTSEPRDFTAEEINSAEAFAETGAIAIENARMYERIKQDYESVMSDIYNFVGYRRSI